MGLWDKLFNKTPVLKGYVLEEHYPTYENAKGETVEMSPEQYQRVQGENVPNDVATTYGIATLPFATMSAPIGIGSKLGNAVLNSAFGGGVYGGINGAINSINDGENPLLGTAKGFGEGALVGGALGVPAHYTGELLNYGAKKALPYIRNVRNGGGLFDKIVVDTQYLFAGENGFNVPKGKLQEAKQLEMYGENNADIRNVIGWFKGVDGKWRYEIPDGKIRETGNYDIVDDYYVPSLKEYHYRLGDMYEAPELYKNYPDLANTKIIIEDMPKEYGGYAKPYDNEIHLNTNDANIINKKYVQRLKEIEDTPEYKYYDKNVYKDNGDYDLKVEEDFLNTPIGEEWEDLQWDNVEELPKYINKGSDILLKKHLTHELQHLIQEKEGFAKGGSYNNESYRNLAGEVEARLAGKRSWLSNEERKDYSPLWSDNFNPYGYDVHPDNQIVEFDYDNKLYDKLTDNLNSRNEWIKINGKDYQILNLPKKNYGKILHILDTNLKINDNIGDVLTRYDDNYAYTFKKIAPTEYKFIKRVKLK